MSLQANSDPLSRPIVYNNLSYCFCRVVKGICVAIPRVDGALKTWAAIHLGGSNSKQNRKEGNDQEPAYRDVSVPVMKINALKDNYIFYEYDVCANDGPLSPYHHFNTT